MTRGTAAVTAAPAGLPSPPLLDPAGGRPGEGSVDEARGEDDAAWGGGSDDPSLLPFPALSEATSPPLLRSFLPLPALSVSGRRAEARRREEAGHGHQRWLEKGGAASAAVGGGAAGGRRQATGGGGRRLAASVVGGRWRCGGKWRCGGMRRQVGNVGGRRRIAGVSGRRRVTGVSGWRRVAGRPQAASSTRFGSGWWRYDL
uniref:Uncharacterized protein n=1 Tax=Oryza nivara TaxID=4536 RepID=A0A0E0J8X1_ORYNI